MQSPKNKYGKALTLTYNSVNSIICLNRVERGDELRLELAPTWPATPLLIFKQDPKFA